jgi:uncharacterized protein with PIN domain
MFRVVVLMTEKEPDTIVCYFCSTPATQKKHRVETSKFVRILWNCSKCGREYWKDEDYGEKESAHERKTRWHQPAAPPAYFFRYPK